MTHPVCRHAVAHEAAAGLTAALLIERCRSGAEQALLPQGRWLGAATQGLLRWLHEGGFANDDLAHDTLPTATQQATTQTAAGGRHSRDNILRTAFAEVARNGNSLGTASVTRRVVSSAQNNHRALGC